MAPVPAETLPRTIARRLVAAILCGQFKTDERLVIDQLARQLHVSPTPVREALAEVAALGLIELHPNRGPVVPRFGPEHLRDIYLVRALLESEVTRLACPRVDVTPLRRHAATLRAMKRAAEIDEPALFALDLELHELIHAACPSQRLTLEVGRYRSLMIAIHDAVGRRPGTQRRVIREHLEILNALLARDADRAGLAMRRHVERSADDMCMALFKRGDA